VIEMTLAEMVAVAARVIETLEDCGLLRAAALQDRRGNRSAGRTGAPAFRED